jgi:hypothetical protein
MTTSSNIICIFDVGQFHPSVTVLGKVFAGGYSRVTVHSEGARVIVHGINVRGYCSRVIVHGLLFTREHFVFPRKTSLPLGAPFFLTQA